MPLADWSVPFNLTSTLYAASPLPINTAIPGSGMYLLNKDGCSLGNQVRFTNDNIPQASGQITHRRFLAGMEMNLAIQLWETVDKPACDDLAQTMLDELMGYLVNLLNAGDDEGRISWTPSGQNARMLDDLRLASYPAENQQSAAVEIAVTLDCALPYSEDLTQQSIVLGGSTVVTNAGNTDAYPVIILDGPFTNATVENATTGMQFEYDGSQAGAISVTGGNIAEINCFRNTIYLGIGGTPGDDTNLKPGIVMDSSEFFTIVPGANTINLSGCTGTMLLNSAWA